MREILVKLWKHEEGQATTEYTLMLAIILGMLVIMINKLIKPVFSKLLANVTNQIERQAFGANLHSFRVPR